MTTPREAPLPALEGNPLLDERRRLGPIGRSHPARQELVRRYAYGIPTREALAGIAAVSPNGLVEVGAGTGYWARLLHEIGVDVLAYDRFPPASHQNAFVDPSTPWFPVHQGDELTAANHPTRTLLVVWPTWNEPWAAAAAVTFHAAGGSQLVYIGEGPGGRTGDRSLHALLGAYGSCLSCTLGVLDEPCICDVRPLWRPVHRITIPQWAGADDACCIYERDPGALPSGRIGRLRRARPIPSGTRRRAERPPPTARRRDHLGSRDRRWGLRW